MPSLEWHRDRISELKLMRQHRVDVTNIYRTINIALLSIAAVFLIFEMQKPSPSPLGLITLGMAVLILIPFLLYTDKSINKFDIKLRRNYNALLGRKKGENLRNLYIKEE